MKLRDYQKPAFKAITKAINEGIPKASLYAATGAGKTVIFQATIEHLFNTGSASKILVVHPRIALSIDQQERFANMFKCGFTSFHSGSVVQNTTSLDEINVMNQSTTSSEKLKEIVFGERSSENHIVFTSYNSVDKIVDMDFDVVIFDEAHYLAQNSFSQILDKNITAKQFFFTATPTKDVLDDESRFGPVIDQILPKTLIEKGFLVEPRMFYSQVKTDQKGDVLDYASAIAHTFVQQRNELEEELTPKMLVALPDTTQFDNIMSKIKEMREIAGQDLHVYSISASQNFRNGSPIQSRADAIKQFADSPVPSIILHCDTLAEGIDVDGLTGVFICRGLSQEKFIQTVGRSIRPSKKDFNVNGMPKAFSRRIKKHGLVSVAVVDGEMKTDARVAQWFSDLKNAGFDNIGEIMNFQEYDGAKDDPSAFAQMMEKTQTKILDIQFQEDVTSMIKSFEA